MLREVVGAIMAAFVGIILLWMILPMLKNAQNLVFSVVNTTDPAVQQLMALGDTLYYVMGFLVIFVTGFIILSYASRNDPYNLGGG